MNMVERRIPNVIIAEVQAREQRHQRRVRFDRVRQVIDVAGYSLHLDEARNAVELLDWLVQISHKSYIDPQRFRDVFDELEDACVQVFGNTLQGVYCPWAEPRIVDWRRGVTRPARLEERRRTERQPTEDGKGTRRRGAKARARKAR